MRGNKSYRNKCSIGVNILSKNIRINLGDGNFKLVEKKMSLGGEENEKTVSFILMIIIILCCLVGCGKGDATEPIEEIAGIESYTTEELQATLGFIAIKEEFSSQIADIKSIKIREIKNVQKPISEDSEYIAFKTLFTYNITYKNENGGESLFTVSAIVENSIDSISLLGEVDMMIGRYYKYYENYNVDISIDTIDLILDSFGSQEIAKELYAREQQ